MFATTLGGGAGVGITGVLVINACAAMDVLATPDPGSSISDTTTAAPPIAPIAVATKAMRVFREVS